MIGDIFERGAEGIVNAIKKLPSGSGKACWKKCDVTNWEDLVALFELAMGKFGGVDIVVRRHYSRGALLADIDFGRLDVNHEL